MTTFPLVHLLNELSDRGVAIVSDWTLLSLGFTIEQLASSCRASWSRHPDLPCYELRRVA